MYPIIVDNNLLSIVCPEYSQNDLNRLFGVNPVRLKLDHIICYLNIPWDDKYFILERVLWSDFGKIKKDKDRTKQLRHLGWMILNDFIKNKREIEKDDAISKFLMIFGCYSLYIKSQYTEERLEFIRDNVLEKHCKIKRCMECSFCNCCPHYLLYNLLSFDISSKKLFDSILSFIDNIEEEYMKKNPFHRKQLHNYDWMETVNKFSYFPLS